MAHKILILINTFQAALGAYNLYLASISISKLLGYEDKAKKAAEWSNIAGNQLYKTRITQASGTLATLLSFTSSVYMIFNENSSLTTKWLIAGVNVAALLAAGEHVGSFWKGKAKIPIPGVGDYNTAIGKTQEGRLNLLYLAGAWAASAVASLLF